MLAGTSNDHFVPIPKGKKKDVVGSLKAGEVAYTVGYGDYRKAASYVELLSVIKGRATPKVNEYTSAVQPVTLFFDIDFKIPASVDEAERAKQADIDSKLVYGKEPELFPSDDERCRSQYDDERCNTQIWKGPSSTSSNDTEEERRKRDEELALGYNESESESEIEPFNHAIPLTSHFDVPVSQMTQQITDDASFEETRIFFSMRRCRGSIKTVNLRNDGTIIIPIVISV
jgi:hypothetical protein